MCRMVGLVSAGDAAAAAALPSWQHLVGAPHSLRSQATTGCVPAGCAPGHTDSWGIGWFYAAGDVSLLRQTGWAEESAFYVFAAESAQRQSAVSGPATVLLGHLRKATQGAVTSDNAHPIRADFVLPGARETLLVAHNGTLRTPLLQTLRDDLAESPASREDSDTAVLAAWLARRVSASRGSVWEGLTAALRELLERVPAVAPQSASDAYSALNLLIAHRTGLFALRQFSRNEIYYTLQARPGMPGEGASWIVASEPTDDRMGWETLTPGELVWFGQDGNVRTARVA